MLSIVALCWFISVLLWLFCFLRMQYKYCRKKEMLKYLWAHKTPGGWRHKCKEHTDWNAFSIDRNGTQWLFVFTQLLNAWHILLQSGATARHLMSLWSITTQIPTLVAVTVGAASIYVLLVFMHRADLGTINNHHWHLFIFPSLGTASRCERSEPETHGVAQLQQVWWKLAWSVMMKTPMKWYYVQPDRAEIALGVHCLWPVCFKHDHERQWWDKRGDANEEEHEHNYSSMLPCFRKGSKMEWNGIRAVVWHLQITV